MPALEWSPLEDDGRSAPAVLYTKKVSNYLFATHEKYYYSVSNMILINPLLNFLLI